MTIADALHQATATLTDAGVDTPRLDAELLLAYALGETRLRLRVYPDQEVLPAQAECFAELVARRAQREPLAYLVGEREFYGRPLIVAPGVLIPRPETELLVEAVIAWARAHGATRLADIGTGSGAIAVTLAAELPEAVVYAVDISQDALVIAERNVHRFHLSERMILLEGNELQPLRERGITGLDALVANLPYIPGHDLAALMPEVRDYEPRLALDGGDDGLALVRRVIADAPAAVRSGGLLALEVGWRQAQAVVDLVAQVGARDIRIITDYGGIERHVLAEMP